MACHMDSHFRSRSNPRDSQDRVLSHLLVIMGVQLAWMPSFERQTCEDRVAEITSSVGQS